MHVCLSFHCAIEHAFCRFSAQSKHFMPAFKYIAALLHSQTAGKAGGSSSSIDIQVEVAVWYLKFDCHSKGSVLVNNVKLYVAENNSVDVPP